MFLLCYIVTVKLIENAFFKPKFCKVTKKVLIMLKRNNAKAVALLSVISLKY